MTEVTLYLWQLICLLVAAVIGAIVILLFIVYLIALVLDLTYWDRHRPKEYETNCPYFIEGEDNKNE